MHQHVSGPQPHQLTQPLRFTATTERVRGAIEAFLQRCCHASVLGPELTSIIDDVDGRSRLERLLVACGFSGDAFGFFTRLIASVHDNDGEWRSVKVNGMAMPHALLLAVLEAVEPGDDIIDVTSITELEELIGRHVPEVDRVSLQEVLDRYPVRLSRHSLRQLHLSSAVARQYLPFVGELDPGGLVHTWVGQFHSGVIERMYGNRVIMILNMSCPVYCRFCFRKHKECRQDRPPTRAEVEQGIDYIRSRPEISEVVLTGGEPFMNRATLTCAVEGLLAVEHVRVLRIATRSLSYHPALLTQRDRFWMSYLRSARRKAALLGKRVEIATHFIHPDELSVRSLELIAELVTSGIPVYVQTPLLGGINDAGDELVQLYRRLRGAGAEVHYIFMPCSPLQGNRAYGSTVDDGMRTAAHLRARVSDRAMPGFCTATAFGKIDWGTDGWVVGVDPDDHRFVWLRTPYTAETFAPFTDDLDLSNVARRNQEGTLDARFMVEVGDRRWLRGPRAATPDCRTSPLPTVPDGWRTLSRFRTTEHDLSGPDAAGTLRRVTMTRAEIDLTRASGDLEDLIAELNGWAQVTDVVIWSSQLDPLHRPRRLARLIDGLAAAPGVTAIRVRSAAALRSPADLSQSALEVLLSRNRLGAVNPLRLELELRVLHQRDLSEEHGQLVARLAEGGVTVYSTTLLLAGVNLSPSAMLGISSACRRYGIEFHHLVIAGEPAQARWNATCPVTVSQVVEAASELRRAGSGRELPKYVVQTYLGEVDLGLTAEPVGVDGEGRARLRLLPYKVGSNGAVEPWGVLSEHTATDEGGVPIVTVPGLTC